jgi:hypothetical protein
MVPEATRGAQSAGMIGGGLPEPAEPRPSSAPHSTAATTMLQGDQGDTGAEVRATPFQVLYGGQPTTGSGAAEQRG